MTPSAPTNPPIPPEVQAIINQLGTLKVSLNVDFPPLTAILNLADEIRATMDPALRARLDAMDLDFRERLYWGVVVPILRGMGLHDPPVQPSPPTAMKGAS